ncbi:MAG: hypothetical protein H7Y17_05385 [Chlorobia bacterium]|nr:hypothetical protein [Fimbriimonadaceae bacterium]
MRKLALFASLMVMPLGAYANLITNGDFEAGNGSGFLSDYSYVANPTDPVNLTAAATYTITDDMPFLWHSAWRGGPGGNQADDIADFDLATHGNYMLINGATNDALKVWYADPALSLSPGQYRFEFDMITTYRFDSALAQIRIQLGDALSSVLVAPAGTDGWQHYSVLLNFNSGPETILFNLQEAAGGNDFGIDNLSLEAVPEPVTVSLGVLGIAAFLRRRLKSQKAA